MKKRKKDPKKSLPMNMHLKGKFFLFLNQFKLEIIKIYKYRLLESNKHIDEEAAKLLLERGLTKVDGKLEYTRDLRLVTGVSLS